MELTSGRGSVSAGALSAALTVLYRGPLSSCNYACPYCPFAKRQESLPELQADERALRRFVDWASARGDSTAVLFTPWGEALIRRWYQQAIVELSHAPRVTRVAIQTNLHARLDFLDEANIDAVGLWCTYHPEQIDRARFVAQCVRLDEIGVAYSVGVVGLREHFDEIRALRDELPESTYLWINAYKREPDYYSPGDIEFLESVDHLFRFNLHAHPSLGAECRTGFQAITVDGAGDARRCHFVPGILGNIYEPDFERALVRRACPNQSCGCHIGYVHLDSLGLDETFGRGLLERSLETQG